MKASRRQSWFLAAWLVMTVAVVVCLFWTPAGMSSSVLWCGLVGLLLALWVTHQWDQAQGQPHDADAEACGCLRCRLGRSWPIPAVIALLAFAVFSTELGISTPWRLAVTLGALAAIAVGVGLKQGRAQRRRRDLTTCVCGYDLTMLEGSICPECGRHLGSQVVEQMVGRIVGSNDRQASSAHEP